MTAPVTVRDRQQAHRADAQFDAHRDDPGLAYRSLLEEARTDGQVMAPRTARALCSTSRRWSSFALLQQKDVLHRRPWATRPQLRIAIVTWVERT